MRMGRKESVTVESYDESDVPVRAYFLAAMMVLSVVAMSAAFAGAAL